MASQRPTAAGVPDAEPLARPTPGRGDRGTRARDALLAAARAVAAESGWHAVTVRRVAERAGCSPALVYEYFASKDALLLELVRDGFGVLRERVALAGAGFAGAGFAGAGPGDADPAGALVAMARAYWAFARDHADLYQVMYGLGGTRYPAGETWAEGSAVGLAFVPVVAALAGADGARGGPREAERRVDTGTEARVYTLWATVHGLIALVLAGRVEGGWPAGEALMLAAVADALTAWRASLRPAGPGRP